MPDAPKTAPKVCPSCGRPPPIHTASCPVVQPTEPVVPTKVVEPEAPSAA